MVRKKKKKKSLTVLALTISHYIFTNYRFTENWRLLGLFNILFHLLLYAQPLFLRYRPGSWWRNVCYRPTLRQVAECRARSTCLSLPLGLVFHPSHPYPVFPIWLDLDLGVDGEL